MVSCSSNSGSDNSTPHGLPTAPLSEGCMTCHICGTNSSRGHWRRTCRRGQHPKGTIPQSDARIPANQTTPFCRFPSPALSPGASASSKRTSDGFPALEPSASPSINRWRLSAGGSQQVDQGQDPNRSGQGLESSSDSDSL